MAKRIAAVAFDACGTLCKRYASFWQCTGEALDCAAARLGLPLDAAGRALLLEGCVH